MMKRLSFWFLLIICSFGLSLNAQTEGDLSEEEDQIVALEDSLEGVTPLNQKGVVSLALQNADVATVMKGISQIGNYDFVTKGEIDKSVNLTLTGRSIREALDIISDSTQTEYRVDGSIITVFGEEQDPSFTKTYFVKKGNTLTIGQVLKDLIGASITTQTVQQTTEGAPQQATAGGASNAIVKGAARIVVDKLNSQIIVSAVPSDHRKIEKVWDVIDIDRPRRRFKSEIFELKFITPQIFVRSIRFLIPGIERTQIFSFADTGSGGEEGEEEEQDAETLSSSEKRVIIQDTPSNLKRIRELLDEIDVPPRQVVIDVKMVEFTLNRDDKLGVDWKTIFTESGRNLPVGEFFSPLAGDGTGRLKFGSLGPDHIQIVLDFIKGNSTAKILSNPQLTVLDGNTATLTVADQIPYRTSIVNQGIVVPQVNFADAGVVLTVTPVIFKNEFVNLTIAPDITSRNGEFDGIPIISQKTTSTTLNIRNNHTVIMGGLISHTKSSERNMIPLIGQIPGVGKFFQNSSTSFRANELVFFITPRIFSEFSNHPHDALKYRFKDKGEKLSESFRFIDQGTQDREYREFLKRKKL
ncbi:type II secretion system protein GspD [bacterium]|jgi:type II secretory pathway component GspD/PulD (secretin)|nr:type II secretion system protein GspD [bacterium]